MKMNTTTDRKKKKHGTCLKNAKIRNECQKDITQLARKYSKYKTKQILQFTNWLSRQAQNFVLFIKHVCTTT